MNNICSCPTTSFTYTHNHLHEKVECRVECRKEVVMHLPLENVFVNWSGTGLQACAWIGSIQSRWWWWWWWWWWPIVIVYAATSLLAYQCYNAQRKQLAMAALSSAGISITGEQSSFECCVWQILTYYYLSATIIAKYSPAVVQTASLGPCE